MMPTSESIPLHPVLKQRLLEPSNNPDGENFDISPNLLPTIGVGSMLRPVNQVTPGGQGTWLFLPKEALTRVSPWHGNNLREESSSDYCWTSKALEKCVTVTAQSLVNVQNGASLLLLCAWASNFENALIDWHRIGFIATVGSHFQRLEILLKKVEHTIRWASLRASAS